MLFMVTQVHSPETCPIDEGGADALIAKNTRGVTVRGRWGAWAHHTVWYLAETDSVDALQHFLDPGMKRCTTTVTPVAENPLKRRASRARP